VYDNVPTLPALCHLNVIGFSRTGAVVLLEEPGLMREKLTGANAEKDALAIPTRWLNCLRSSLLDGGTDGLSFARSCTT
tara:strand:+ start:425 stop:661 length:237 start_codon:yes stop_codon:yes gene_type:complete